MIISSQHLNVEQRTGDLLGSLTKLLEPSQMHDKVKVFAKVALKPGSKVPYHQHVGSFEAFYILAGSGQVNDNGILQQVKTGDVVFTDDSENHALENIGDVDLEYIALVVYS